MSNEIVTLQFGNYSNYVGAHFWNIQHIRLSSENHKSTQFAYDLDKQVPNVSHDVLFREGLNSHNGVTFTPRLILFDLKENLGIVNSINESIENQKTKSINWKGKLEVFKPEQRKISKLDLEKNETDELTNEVAKTFESKDKTIYRNGTHEIAKPAARQIDYWSDLSRIKYHDRSFMLLNSFQAPGNHQNSHIDAFDLYTHGLEAFKSGSFCETFEDNVRHFAEECNSIQGFHMLIDGCNGFGGMAAQSLNYILEEFPKSSILSFLMFPHENLHNKDMSKIKIMNTALTLRGLLEDKSHMAVVPLSLFSTFYSEKEPLKPIQLFSVDYNPNMSYHTSAILASLLDNVTLPWRLKSPQRTKTSDLIEQIDMYTHKIGSVQALYPLRLDESKKYLFNQLSDLDLLNDATYFTPMCASGSSEDVNGFLNVVCRGIDDKLVKNEKDDYYFKGVTPAHVVLDKYLNDMYPKSKRKSFSVQTQLNIQSPYPSIIDITKLSKKNQNSISLLTALQFNERISNWLQYLANHTDYSSIRNQEKYFEAYIEHDDFGELNSFMRDLWDLYSI